MSISSLAKVNIYFHNENKDKLVHKLQELACIHVVDFRETTVAEAHEDLIIENELNDLELECRINELSFAITALSPFEKTSGVLSMLVGKKVLLTKKEYNAVLSSFDETDIVKEVRGLEKEEHVLLTEITNNEAVMRELLPWKKLTINTKDIADTATTCIRLGKIPVNKLANFKKSIDEVTNLYHIQEINTISESAYIIIAYMKEFEDAIDDLLTIESFERKDFKNYSGDVAGIINGYVEKDKRDDERLANIGVELAKYAKELPKLKIVYDNLYNMYERVRVQQRFGETGQVSMVEGYIDREALPTLQKSISEEFDAVHLEEVEIAKDEKPPTKLKNSGVSKSFELVLDMYGMPAFKSFDSTIYLMPFFAVFFGLCLTDGGYGIMLSLFAFFMIKKYKPIFGDSKLMWVLGICGFTTIAAGAITGGWFGDLIDKAPQLSGLVDVKDSMKLFDPMKEPMVFFMLSVALGFIHILFGLVIGFIKHVKDGELAEGLCTKMTWIALLLTLLVLGLSVKVEAFSGFAALGKYGALLSAFAIVFFSEYGAKSFGVRIASGLYNLYGASSYLGDLLSYLRLMALGLASGVIAMVINKMCALSLGIPYGLGYVIATIMFVGGHVFNLVLSGLGAFVHTLRLNYVEFFPKFFVGGGTHFTPFKMETNYMIFNEEKDE